MALCISENDVLRRSAEETYGSEQRTADVPGGVHAGGQRHRLRRARGATRPPSTASSTAGYYQKLGRTLEEGCFDMMFFDDRLAMPGIYGGSVAEAVRLGARPVKLDLSIVLGVVAGATQLIGLGATYSTTYYSPFHVARTFATLDHLSGGRAAWNVVTSVNDSEAQNFGFERAPRPRRALRPGRRVPRGHHRPVGHVGGRRPRARPGRRASSPTPTRCTSSTTRASGSACAARSPCPARPQGRPVLLQAGLVGPGPRLRRPVGRADLHRRPRHRRRPRRTTRTRRSASASWAATPTR